MTDTVIRFSDLTWQYESQAEPTLHGLSFDIKRGEKVLIAGPSGCGKSTIAHCLNGLIPFSYRGNMTGSLKIYDKETRDLSIFDISKMVGTVLQDSDGQFVGLTVAEDIAFALENDCVPQSELFTKVDETAAMVEVQDLLKAVPGELSGGQKQRVSLAGVMVDNVPILLFDEPLANLDPATGKSSIELIDEIQKKTGATVIIIEHRLEDVLWRHVDRIILMSEGRIAADMTPNELLSTDMLEKRGIREPLYITALKYAGVEITRDKRPEHINSLRLTEEDRDKVRSWYERVPASAAEDEKPILMSVSDVTFSYISNRKNPEDKKNVLEDVTLDIRKGEMMSLVGKNGAGKSTLAKTICGFNKLDQGSIKLFKAQTGSPEEIDLGTLSIKERADHIGYVMQNPNQMISQVMIRDEVALGLVKRGVDEETVENKVNQALKTCGLYEFRNWPVSALSYGQKKRVTIASILALDPEIIILDEPTAGQDYRHYTDIMEFLRELNKKGVTIIVITHDMHLMLEYCMRTVVLTDGHKVGDTTPAHLLNDIELIRRAYLRETSLYELARICGIDDGCSFTQRFIDYERARREEAQNG